MEGLESPASQFMGALSQRLIMRGEEGRTAYGTFDRMLRNMIGADATPKVSYIVVEVV
jgi:hypothetical protein